MTHNSMWVHKSPRDSSGFGELARPLASCRFRGSRPSPGSLCRCPDSSRLVHFYLGYGRGTTGGSWQKCNKSLWCYQNWHFITWMKRIHGIQSFLFTPTNHTLFCSYPADLTWSIFYVGPFFFLSKVHRSSQFCKNRFYPTLLSYNSHKFHRMH